VKTLFPLAIALLIAAPRLVPAEDFMTELAVIQKTADQKVGAIALDGLRQTEKPKTLTVAKVADDATWRKLLERATTRPTRVHTAHAGGTDYKVYIVYSETPVVGQDCPAGTHAQNTLYVSKPDNGTGREIYPVRIAALCMGPSAVRDSFSLDADWDGTILDIAVNNGSLGLVVHPLNEPLSSVTPAEPTDLTLFLARLAKFFLEAP
jgi:hypothetical protein